MQALIDAMEEGVIAVDAQGRVRRTNPAARRMFSLGADSLGMPPQEVTRRPGFLQAVGRVLGGEAVPASELTLDGLNLLATAQPLPGGGAVMVFLDVSQLRRLEGVRRDFVANASHELKTPLTVIRGYSETLLDPELPAALRLQFAETVKTNADRLQRIVDDLLDLSRLESGAWRTQPEVVAVRAAAADAWGPFQGEAAARGATLAVETGSEAEHVFADPGALRQILSNLFSNALRYLPPGGLITLRSRREGEGALERVVVEVSDNGAGIGSQHLPRIFERFYRADAARSREEGGTGLGLAIVKHLVEEHGGRVEAESRLGQGTTIRFALPMPEPAAA
jgi:signal transduction histidine kinase